MTLPSVRRAARLPSSSSAWFRPLHRCPHHHRLYSSTPEPPRSSPESAEKHQLPPQHGVFATLYPSGSPSSPLKVVKATSGPPVPYADRAKELPPSHRTLPRPPNHAPLFIGTFLVAVTLWGLFIYHATNSERANSSVVRSILFHLRTSPAAVEALGRGVKGEKGKLTDTLWVDGNINMMQGSVDLAFRVKGDKAAGKIFFTSVRRTKSSRFEIVRWRIIRDDGAVFDLRQEITSRLSDRSVSLLDGRSGSVTEAPEESVVVIDFDRADDPFALSSSPAKSTAVATRPLEPPEPVSPIGVREERLV